MSLLKSADLKEEPLIDPFDRMVNYLRVSVTDRCDFRCVYCMSENMSFLPKAEVLSLEELDRLCSSFVHLGVKKLRLTGGEPLVRRDIMWLIKQLSRHLDSGKLNELTLTTNGSQLSRYADDLAACGVKRLNVSLDTLQAPKFLEITRWGKFDKVMAGLQAAKKAGIAVKLNCVAVKGVNDDEIHDLVQYCGDEGFDLTFIEVMPMGDIGNEARIDQYYPLSELKQDLAERWTLMENSHRTGGPARYMTCQETGGRIGFITPLTHNFCESCNRVRVTCTGMLYLCLGQADSADLRSVMRGSDDEQILAQAIRDAIARKPKGHDFIIDRTQGIQSSSNGARYMSTTGG